MCDKKPYCARDIDPCLRKEISHINTFIPFAKTFASCCGHNKYPRSIFYYNIKTKEVFEWYTCLYIGQYKKGMKIYVKDWEGYYFNPQIVTITITRKIHCRRDN